MDGFADKLTLVIKTLGISRAELGAALAVDKSVVSRWFAGARAPTAHNLAAITALIAARAPGFTMLDWDRDLAGLEPRLRPGGAERAHGPDNALCITLPDDVAGASHSRARSYEGIWRMVMSGGMAAQPGLFMMAHLLIQTGPNGQLALRGKLFGDAYLGYGVIVGNQAFILMMSDPRGMLTLAILNVVDGAGLADGLMLSCHQGMGGAPFACPTVAERVADLTGDPPTDEARFASLSAQGPMAPEGVVSEATRNYLLRDIGPAAAARGGELLLMLPFMRSLASQAGG